MKSQILFPAFLFLNNMPMITMVVIFIPMVIIFIPMAIKYVPWWPFILPWWKKSEQGQWGRVL